MGFKKYSAFTTFKSGNSKMEFSNSLIKLQSLILVESVVCIRLFDCVNDVVIMTIKKEFDKK